MEHIVQTLILVIHLALLNIVIGGIQMRELYDGVLKPVSLSNDWAGLIGLNRNEMNLSWWIIFYTLASFFITILFIAYDHRDSRCTESKRFANCSNSKRSRS